MIQDLMQTEQNLCLYGNSSMIFTLLLLMMEEVAVDSSSGRKFTSWNSMTALSLSSRACSRHVAQVLS
jgi:hypothetical protein